MSEKEKYIIYVEKEAVEVSKEIYEVYYKGERKERYFSKDLKESRIKINRHNGEKIILPSREDSYERLLEAEQQFASDSEIPEDMAIRTMMLERIVIQQIKRCLIRHFISCGFLLLRYAPVTLFYPTFSVCFRNRIAPAN